MVEDLRGDLHGAVAAGNRVAAGNDDASDQEQWVGDYESFRHGRLERVQASAQQWLATITALLGLFSAAVVVGGGSSVSDLSAAERKVVFVVAVVVYSAAFVAVVIGAMATFGGLGLRSPSAEDLESYADAERARSEAAGQVARYYRGLASGTPEQAAVHAELAAEADRQTVLHAHQADLATARRQQRAAPELADVVARAEPSRWQIFWGSDPVGLNNLGASSSAVTTPRNGIR